MEELSERVKELRKIEEAHLSVLCGNRGRIYNEHSPQCRDKSGECWRLEEEEDWRKYAAAVIPGEPTE